MGSVVVVLGRGHVSVAYTRRNGVHGTEQKFGLLTRLVALVAWGVKKLPK